MGNLAIKIKNKVGSYLEFSIIPKRTSFHCNVKFSSTFPIIHVAKKKKKTRAMPK